MNAHPLRAIADAMLESVDATIDTVVDAGTQIRDITADLRTRRHELYAQLSAATAPAAAERLAVTDYLKAEAQKHADEAGRLDAVGQALAAAAWAIELLKHLPAAADPSPAAATPPAPSQAAPALFSSPQQGQAPVGGYAGEAEHG